MTLDPKKIAERLGAQHIGQGPDTGGGAFGMARLAEIMKHRLNARESQSGPAFGWVRTKILMSAETEKLLIALADKLSTPERPINPTQLATQLLEESVRRMTNEHPQ